MSLPNGPYGALETPCVDLSAPGDFPLQGYVDLSEEAISHEEQEPFPKDESPYFSPQSLPGVFPGQEKFCSPLSANQTIATSVNSLLISSNLVQLYHDVFEHNLSCWLTESTCPYLLHGSQTNLQVRANTQSYTEQTNAQSTYNRIYRRTVELDKAALAAGVISLTPLQDQAASEALNLAVLAFSAQWAQGSQRARADFASSLRQSNDYRSKTPEFDETLQRQLWETAKAALERTAYLESYRVAYAEVIFALTQRSWDDGSKVNVHELPTSGAVKSRINEIIAQEGPPIYMERAARKIHILESRIDTALGKAKSHYAKANTKSIIELNMRHHGTLRLLHWLVVMVDTVSSSMYERPLVISDEEIQFCPSDQPNECATSEVRRLRENALGIQNFIRDNLSDPAYLPQWPCSFAEASYAVAQAAQVKVLLFRQVSCLQRYIRQGRPRGDIDSLVQTAIKIRSFWQSTYGCFFMQLSENIDSVPQRIQNWYLCIGAHWNLAVLILADLLETIASSELTPERDMQASRLKLSSQFRKTASEELAYLAYVATPDHDPRANPQLSEFHHALDESRVLAEPYAMMLIRGFTKAAMNLLNVLENSVLEVEVDLNRRRASRVHKSSLVPWQKVFHGEANCRGSPWDLPILPRARRKPNRVVGLMVWS
ncbi:hypothetical protein N7470_009333 [Penicillium chermesinum]|nr:hypothetical protein N7470_009333 [Penicillium chermesinum]